MNGDGNGCVCKSGYVEKNGFCISNGNNNDTNKNNGNTNNNNNNNNNNYNNNNNNVNNVNNNGNDNSKYITNAIS